MPCSCVSKPKKMAAGILSALLLFAVLFSSFYIAAETGHDCTGEDCPICVCLQLCESTLHRIGEGTVLLAVLVIPVILLTVPIVLYAPGFVQETPVSRKVRLND